MYKSSFVSSSVPVSSDRRVFDTSFLSDYAINESGHIRSDFAVLQEQNDSLANFRLLQRIEEYGKIDVNKDKTVEQILAEIKPRMVETPAERDRFEQYCLDRAIDFYKTLQQSEAARLAVGSGDSKPSDGSSSEPPQTVGPAPAE